MGERGYCIRINGSATCDLGFTAGTGWAMLLYPESAPQWFKTLLNIGWLAGLWLPAGFWGASRWGAAIVTTASVATLGVVSARGGPAAHAAYGVDRLGLWHPGGARVPRDDCSTGPPTRC